MCRLTDFQGISPWSSGLGLWNRKLIKIGYEVHRVEPFLFFPSTCYRSHKANGHLAKECKNAMICAKCAQLGHRSSRDSPYEIDLSCVSCKSNRHNYNSLRSSENNKLLSEKTRNSVASSVRNGQ